MRGVLAITFGVSFGAHLFLAAALFSARSTEPQHHDMPPAPQLAGETFELPAPETQEIPLATVSPAPESTAASSGARTAARASGRARPAVAREVGQADGTAGRAEQPALYGAVGERSAADLATAFTRGFPQAASADPAWRAAALGSAGEADVVLTLDEEGHIESSQVVGTPSAALSSAIRRTLALIKGRSFVAHAKTTKLHLSATVSGDAVHDGLHGDVFAIGGSFTGGEGNAFFALAIGRRIDVHVRSK